MTKNDYMLLAGNLNKARKQVTDYCIGDVICRKESDYLSTIHDLLVDFWVLSRSKTTRYDFELRDGNYLSIRISELAHIIHVLLENEISNIEDRQKNI